MLIPYGTDAPLYHYPLSTIAIIAVNTLMFCATGMGMETGLHDPYRWLILEFNQINPLQWITAAFMHASWMHLVGNMIFLWCFGLVVEGKLGWRRFALLYLALAAAEGAITQVPMFFLAGGHGGALGASGVIFALIAVALVWAPDNDMHCLFPWSYFYIRQVDVRIIHLALFYFALEMLDLMFAGFHMSTPMLHLLGLAVGFPFAFYMLRKDLVDCEGWDVISRYGTGSPWSIAGRMLSRSLHRPASRAMVSDYNQSGRQALATIMANPSNFDPSSVTKRTTKRKPSPPITSLCQAIESDSVDSAIALFDRISLQWGTHVLSEQNLARYAQLLSSHHRYEKSLQPLQILVSRRSKLANRARLQIAKIQLQVHGDPESAAVTLQQMVRPWSESTERKRRRLLQAVSGLRMEN